MGWLTGDKKEEPKQIIIDGREITNVREMYGFYRQLLDSKNKLDETYRATQSQLDHYRRDYLHVPRDSMNIGALSEHHGCITEEPQEGVTAVKSQGYVVALVRANKDPVVTFDPKNPAQVEAALAYIQKVLEPNCVKYDTNPPQAEVSEALSTEATRLSGLVDRLGNKTRKLGIEKIMAEDNVVSSVRERRQ